MLDNLSANHSSTDVEWCNQTTTQKPGEIQQQNSFNRRKYSFWSSLSPNLSLIEMVWRDLKRKKFTPDIPRILQRWDKRNGAKFLLTVEQDWSANAGSFGFFGLSLQWLLSNYFEQVTTSVQNILPKKLHWKSVVDRFKHRSDYCFLFTWAFHWPK